MSDPRAPIFKSPPYEENSLMILLRTTGRSAEPNSQNPRFPRSALATVAAGVAGVRWTGESSQPRSPWLFPAATGEMIPLCPIFVSAGCLPCEEVMLSFSSSSALEGGVCLSSSACTRFVNKGYARKDGIFVAL